MPKRNALTPKQLLFVAEYLKDNNGARAALAAGYSKASARRQAYQMLNHQPEIKAAIDAERKKLQTAAGYNLEKAMAEIDDAIKFSIVTGNATAYAKLLELKTKLHGMLIERHDVRQLGQFTINISGFKHGVKDDDERT